MLKLAEHIAQELMGELGVPGANRHTYSDMVAVWLSDTVGLGVFHTITSASDSTRVWWLGQLARRGVASPGYSVLPGRWSLEQPDSVQLALAWARSALQELPCA